MEFPTLKPLRQQKRTISTFGGLDLRHAIADGSFAKMENLTADDHPLLGVRSRRGLVATTGPLGGMTVKDGLCYVNGTDFVINGHALNMGLTPGEKQLVSMGAYVVIFPDKKYVNTLDTTDWGSLEAEYTSQTGVIFTLCDPEGKAYADMITATEAPENPKDRQYWLDTSAEACVLRRYSGASESWAEIYNTWVRVQAEGIGKGFSQYDGVVLSGIAAKALQGLNGATVLEAVEENAIVIPGILAAAVTQDPDQGAVRVERRVPELDFVIEADNRLWGCHYGFDREGKAVNQLYACKLGDFKNWQCFRGLSTDSYVASLGADGPFTGAVTHLGYPLFFRENCLHKVYGSYPAEYRIQTTACRGVAQGSHKSLAIVDGALYYLSSGGVCVYDGALPENVSPVLGKLRFHSGVAGALGSKYYISMQDEKDRPGLYVLDTARHMWHREDSLPAKVFCARDESLFCHDGQHIWDLAGVTGEQEKPVTWMACTGRLSAKDPDRRYIRRITARLAPEEGAAVRFYARYDGAGPWCFLGAFRGKGLRTVSVPMGTRRCESLELRLEGRGQTRLFSLTLTSEQGSDLP